VYGPTVNRLTPSIAALLLGLFGLTGTGFAQQGHHDGGGRGHFGGAPAPRFAPPGGGGRYGAPAPGGRWAGPYGYAYPAGVYPGYPQAPPRPQGPYPPPPYGAAPAPRNPNSLGADWRQQQEEARAAVKHGQFAPLGRVIEDIRRRAPGRQLDAGIEYDGGRPIYRVRWITVHGRRVDFMVDAASGAIIGER
jgi:hypothetical protein